MNDFEERQEFPIMLGIFVHGSLLVAVAGALLAIRPDPSAGPRVLGAALFGMAAIWLISRFVQLTTLVGDADVRVKGLFFIDRRIAFGDIAVVEPRRYRPLAEYGGWGYRIGPSGKAYNMRGDEGVQLILKDGGRVLIGSQRAQELAGVIRQRMNAGDRA